MDKDQLLRKLAVILHADVVGSTALVQKNETLAHERIQDSFRRFGDTIARYNGRVRELRGDALLAEFERASDAISAALVFQAENAKFNATLKDDIQPQLRVGISLGEVVIADGTATGAGVVLAQRVEQLADAGGICITGAIHEAVPQHLPILYTDIGRRPVKGFEEAVQVYQASVKAGGQIAPAEPARPQTLESPYRIRRLSIIGVLATLVAIIVAIVVWQPWKTEFGLESPAIAPISRPAAPAIAVLAFDNMTGDPSFEYFSDGISDHIITSLSRSPWLIVMSRSSSFAYKGQEATPQKIADELGVHYVLRGSVYKSTNKVRITAQLIDAETGKNVWADGYDEEGDDVLALQNAVTIRIIDALGVSTGGTIQTDAYKRAWAKSTGLKEYDYVLRGHSRYFKFTNEDMARAREIYEEGLEQFPDSALLKAHLGWALTDAAQLGWSDDPGRDLQHARKLAEEAVVDEGAPLLAEAVGRALLAALYFFIEGDAVSAVAEQERARDLIPGDGMAQSDLAWYQVHAGKLEDARKSLQFAERAAPDYPFLPMARGEVFHATGKYRKAIDAMNALTIDLPDKYRLLASCYVELGMDEEAKSALNKFLELAPKANVRSLREELTYVDKTFVEKHIENLRAAGLPD